MSTTQEKPGRYEWYDKFANINPADEWLALTKDAARFAQVVNALGKDYSAPTFKCAAELHESTVALHIKNIDGYFNYLREQENYARRLAEWQQIQADADVETSDATASAQ